MDEVVGYLIVAIFVGGLIFSLSHHIRLIKTERKTSSYRRSMVANYLSSFVIAGFLIAYLMNIGVNLGFVSPGIISSSATNAGCFLFVGILIISKVFITPREHYSLPKHN